MADFVRHLLIAQVLQCAAYYVLAIVKFQYAMANSVRFALYP